MINQTGALFNSFIGNNGHDVWVITNNTPTGIHINGSHADDNVLDAVLREPAEVRHADQLEALAKPVAKSGYGQYLLALRNERHIPAGTGEL